MSKEITLLLVLLAFFLGVGLLVGLPYYEREKRRQAHVLGENLSYMNSLNNALTTATVGEYSNFLQIVETGSPVDATYLASRVFDSELSVAARGYLTDFWGHPFHLIITRKSAEARSGHFWFNVFIWSDGPNGVNEMGKGDDISDSFVIECSP